MPYDFAKKPAFILTVAGALLVLIFGWLWWTKVYESPYNVWWGMLSNSLSTPSATKHIVEQTNGTKLDQYIGYQFGVNSQAYATTTLTNSSGKVTTESLGTLKNDYVRYTAIDTSQKDKNGKKLDASPVLNHWAQTPAANTSDQNASVPFFIQSLLGVESGNVVPMANLAPADRASLMQQLRNSAIFDTSFSAAKHQRQNGRPVYVYSVSVEPVAYVALEKAFATVLGIKALDNVEPNSYQGDSAIKMDFTVDVRSRQLVEVSYPGDSHQEYYSGYGVSINAPTPHASISPQKLQSFIDQIQ